MSQPSDAIRRAVAASRESAVSGYVNGQPSNGHESPRSFADRVIQVYLDATYGPGAGSGLDAGEMGALRGALYWDTVADQFPGADGEQAATIAANQRQAQMYAQTIEHGLQLGRRDAPAAQPAAGDGDPTDLALQAVIDKIPGLVALDPTQRQNALLRAVGVAQSQAGSDPGRFQSALESALLVSEAMLAPQGGDAGAGGQAAAPPSNATPAQPPVAQHSPPPVARPAIAPPPTASGAVSIPGGEAAGAGTAEPMSPYKLAAAQARARAQATYAGGIPTQPGGGVPIATPPTPTPTPNQ